MIISGKFRSQVNTDEALEFAPESEAVAEPNQARWKILVADDDQAVHDVTRLALKDFQLDGRGLEIIGAYSGLEAVGALVETPDIALVLMDVVMESESAGLDAVAAIRNRLGNKLVRIILRTGQPGSAPEETVIREFDINDYREKVDLTSKRLSTAVHIGLSQFQELSSVNETNASLTKILEATPTVFQRRLPERLARGSLQLLSSVLGLDGDHDKDASTASHGAVLIDRISESAAVILAGTGRFESMTGQPYSSATIPEAHGMLRSIRRSEVWRRNEHSFAAKFEKPGRPGFAVFLQSDSALKPVGGPVLEAYCKNLEVSIQASHATRDMDCAQSQLIVMLSEAIERRSRETGNHVRRVGEYSRLLGSLYGLEAEEVDVLLIGAALHDAGKVAIPDAILNKPGKLTQEERAIMETHAAIGAEMFANQKLPVLRAASIIAHQHHEKFDGTGYPNRLKGNEIHLYGRISALADVFDALGSHRCYKRAWPLDEILALIQTERGRHFDPVIVDLFLKNLGQFLEIRDRFVDAPPPELAVAGA